MTSGVVTKEKWVQDYKIRHDLHVNPVKGIIQARFQWVQRENF